MQAEEKRAAKQLILVFPAKSFLWEAILFRLFFQRLAPSALFVLAALTPKDYRIKIIHQKIFWLPHDFISGALVGISCNTANVHESYRIADRFRRAGSTVVMGGSHVSHLPQEALQHCDSLVIGEAESVWPQVIKDYECGTMQPIYRGVPLDDWSAQSYEYFCSLPSETLRRMGLLLGRGCKYRCEFCVPYFGKPRPMQLKHATGLVTRAMETAGHSRGKRAVHFFDDNIFADPAYAKQLFRALVPLELQWSSSSSLDIAFDEEALQLAKASGCRFLFVGLETIHPQRFPKTSAGGVKTQDDYIKAIRKIQSCGIKVTGGFILGFDDCTHKYCLELLRFLISSGLNRVEVSCLTPFPGTAIFERLRGEGRITTSDWSRFDPGGHVVFKPQHMSRGALYGWMWFLNIVGWVSAPSVPLRVLNGLMMLCLLGALLFLIYSVVAGLLNILYFSFG